MKPTLLRQEIDYFTLTIRDPQPIIYVKNEIGKGLQAPRLKRILNIFGLTRKNLSFEKPRVEYVFFKNDRSIRLYINAHFIQVQFNGAFWIKENANKKFISYLKRIRKDYGGLELLKITRIDIASDINCSVEKLLQFKPGYVFKGRSRNMNFTQFLNPKTFEVQAVGFRNTRTALIIYDKLEELRKHKRTQKSEAYEQLYEGHDVITRHEIRLFKDKAKTYQDDILQSETTEDLKNSKNKILDYFYQHYRLEKNGKTAHSWSRQKKIVLPEC